MKNIINLSFAELIQRVVMVKVEVGYTRRCNNIKQ